MVPSARLVLASKLADCDYQTYDMKALKKMRYNVKKNDCPIKNKASKPTKESETSNICVRDLVLKAA